METGPQIVDPCGPQDDPGLRLIWLKGRLAVLDSIVTRRWNVLHNIVIGEELELSYRQGEIEKARLRIMTPRQIAKRVSRRKALSEGKAA
jgi:hypothetical protein